jgi:DNA segregation ATPase FtsK/SpoIIIE, S-DNA-T family
MEHCDDCPFTYGDHAIDDLPAELRAAAAALAAALVAPSPEDLRAHPLDGVWSALEYACHVRDVLAVQHERLGRMLVEDRPRNTPMRRDERVAELHYNAQPPAEVGQEVIANAERLAAAFATLDAAGWSRTVLYRWPVETERDTAWLARHTLHEVVHHHRDIDRVLAATPR